MSKLPRGISRTPVGYRARLRVAGQEYSQRFPFGTPIGDMQAWRRRCRAQAENRTAVAPTPGTLADDAERYLLLRLTMPTYHEREQHIREWVRQFGDRPRDQITPAMIQAVREQWLTRGPKLVQRWRLNLDTRKRERYFQSVPCPLSASAVNHRLRALANLWTVLDGRHARNPAREVAEAEEPEGPPRALPVALIRRLIASMPDSVAKAWIAVFAWTGLPHATIARMDASMLDLDGRAMWVPGRKKGQGTRGRRVPMTPDGVAAWRLFLREDAWRRTPPQGNMARTWRGACRRVAETLDDDAVKLGLARSRVYDLRHSIGTLMAMVGDHVATAQVLGVTLPTALRYGRAAIDPRLDAAVRRLTDAQSELEVATEVATETER